MNVLLLIGTYCDYGGTEKVVTLMANHLVRQHHDWTVAIAAFRQECDPQKFGLDTRVQCYSLSDSGASPAAKLREILQTRKIDVVVNHWCLPFYVTRVINAARKGLRVRLISILHGVPDCSKKVIVAEERLRSASGINKLVAWLELWALQLVVKGSIRYVYRHSDKYLVISKGFMDVFRTYSGLKDVSRLDYVYSLTDYMSSGELSLSEKKSQIIYVGRMDKENKRVNRILEAWEAVAHDYPKWNLMLVGGGPHLAELQRYAADREIPNVTFTGFIGDSPAKYYRESSIFMLTSDLEGFGLVLVEAMSYGVVPIVYDSYVTAKEIVDDKVNGCLTPTPYSQAATVGCLRKLMDDRELLQKLALAASRKAQEFTSERIMAKWEKILKD